MGPIQSMSWLQNNILKKEKDFILESVSSHLFLCCASAILFVASAALLILKQTLLQYKVVYTIHSTNQSISLKRFCLKYALEST